jgi:hypothetical protein
MNPSRRAVGANKKVGCRISDERPDFLWTQGAPEFRGYFALLEEIYQQSITP